MTRASHSINKRQSTSGSRTKRPKSRQSAVTEVAPEVVERFARTIAKWGCAVERLDVQQDGTGHDMGGEYIASIAEQRPGIRAHGYPAGWPDWDQEFRLRWSGITKFGEFIEDISRVLPEWMALPLLRRIVWSTSDDDKPDKQDKPENPAAG
jgi:hypothetical protein